MSENTGTNPWNSFYKIREKNCWKVIPPREIPEINLNKILKDPREESSEKPWKHDEKTSGGNRRMYCKATETQRKTSFKILVKIPGTILEIPKNFKHI